MDFSIIIVTYNGEDYLADLFESLLAYTPLDRGAVLVVDNASSDGTVAKLREWAPRFPHFEILDQPTNLGFAGGNNVGIRRARELGCASVFLLNQDTVVTASWLEPLERVLATRPEVATIQPLLLLASEPERVNTAGNAIHFCGFGYCTHYRAAAAEIAAGVRSVTYATGAAVLIRMAALNQVGDFDELLFLYHEDLELQLRMRIAGWECAIEPASRILHKYRESHSPAKYRWMERNRWLVILKTWPLRRLLVTAPPLAAVELAVLVLAAKEGWLAEKVRSYREVIDHLPAMLRARSQIARLRHQPTDAVRLTGVLEFEGFDHPLVRKFANPLLERYWRAVRILAREAVPDPHP
jgi:GT2 family glycosyltransferase